MLITYIGSNGTNDEPKSPNIYYTAFAALGVLIALVFIILLFSVIVRHWTQRRGRSRNQQKHVQLLEFRRKTECEDAKVFNQDINVNGTHTLSKTLSNKDLFANEDITKEVIVKPEEASLACDESNVSVNETAGVTETATDAEEMALKTSSSRYQDTTVAEDIDGGTGRPTQSTSASIGVTEQAEATEKASRDSEQNASALRESEHYNTRNSSEDKAETAIEQGTGAAEQQNSGEGEQDTSRYYEEPEHSALSIFEDGQDATGKDHSSEGVKEAESRDTEQDTKSIEQNIPRKSDQDSASDFEHTEKDTPPTLHYVTVDFENRAVQKDLEGCVRGDANLEVGYATVVNREDTIPFEESEPAEIHITTSGENHSRDFYDL